MTHDIALVGYGYWGPNLLRTFANIPGCNVRYCCDINPANLQEVKKKFPYVLTTTNFEEVIADPSLDGVVLAVPTKSHFTLAQKALSAGKDVLVEKPMTITSQEAWQLVKLAEKGKRILMVDHILLFNTAVLKIKELIDRGEVGEILYIDSTRTNLGLFQKDSNVIFDLASHEFSMIQFFLNSAPKIVSVTGKSHINAQLDVAYITAEYPKNILAHVHITWLSPLKVRRMLVVGSKKMIVYDDNEASEKVKIYDKGIVKGNEIGYRFGDVWTPHLETTDALTLMAQTFIKAISTREPAVSDGKFGAGVVEILENATKLFNGQKNSHDHQRR